MEKIPDPNRPDVHSIIQKIREDIHASSIAGHIDEKILMAEDNLQENLNKASAFCFSGPANIKGIKGLFLRVLCKPFSILFLKDIHQFHYSLLCALKKLVRILEGGDSASFELIEKVRRRVEMTEKLSRRLDAYDDQKIHERLLRIEHLLEQSQEKKSPA